MKRYRTCPDPPKRTWEFPSVGDVSIRLARFNELHSVDMDWAPARRSTDTHGWQWERVFTEVKDCVYALGATAPIALFGIAPKNKMLPAGPTLRLDYFQIAPTARGTGIARLAFAVFARTALDFGAKELIVSSLPNDNVVRFYTSMKGTIGAPPGWQVVKGLVPIRFISATLLELAEFADALEKET